MPVIRVFFPLHKAMDGFMSDEQYERFYWKPLRKIIMALIDMDVTPYIYTEGPYNSRLKFLTDVPKGKVFYHFENVDMAEAKGVLGDTAAICGNLSISRMEFGKKRGHHRGNEKTSGCLCARGRLSLRFQRLPGKLQAGESGSNV